LGLIVVGLVPVAGSLVHLSFILILLGQPGRNHHK
jgi:hypothetical protein